DELEYPSGYPSSDTASTNQSELSWSLILDRVDRGLTEVGRAVYNAVESR
ncbi:MAG: hypothetical protein CEO22_251, partial [Candidatus Berkelbacteria bacterium Gr01-1014_85]